MSEPDPTDADVAEEMLDECLYQWDEANETTEYSTAAIGEMVAARLRAWIKDA